MIKQITFLLILFVGFNCIGQTNFEKGYYISSNGETTNCYIKNIDWKNNPTYFQYKIQENDNPKTATLEEVKEFGINNVSKYIRAEVNIDKSSSKLDKLSNNRAPDFEMQLLFLKVLIEGDVNLYFYEEGDLKRFFFSLQNSDLQQLVYKNYLQGTDIIAENNHFRQQILNNLKCEDKKLKSVKNLDYKKNDLIKVFTNYNLCMNSKTINYGDKQKRELFNLKVKAGLASTSFEISNPSSEFRNVKFDNELSLRLGLEAEFILPFNNNKWSIFIEPTLQNYKSIKEVTNDDEAGVFNNFNVEVKYKTFEVPLGVRYHFFINDNSKIFINCAYKLKFTGNSNIRYSSVTILDIDNGNSFEYGLGYNYKSKYSVEFRMSPTTDILGNYVNFFSNYKNASLLFGYKVF